MNENSSLQPLLLLEGPPGPEAGENGRSEALVAAAGHSDGAGGLRVLGIDPGPVSSAVCWFDGETISTQTLTNEVVLQYLRAGAPGYLLAVEMVASFGMPVGQEIFTTVLWIGRFVEAWGGPFRLVTRMEVKMHICHHPRANDATIRRALLDRFGPPGKKANPGRTYGIRGDEWSALSVALVALETEE